MPDWLKVWMDAVTGSPLQKKKNKRTIPKLMLIANEKS
jgi:hypothetical protein